MQIWSQNNALKLHKIVVRYFIKHETGLKSMWKKNELIPGQEYKAALAALNKSIAGASVDEFLEAAENALEACGMILKKIDKKKDRWAH